MSLWHKHPGVRSGSQLTAGERAADAVRNTMGSWGFVAGFMAAMVAWAIVNSLLHLGGRKGFDPYPFILLNLMLSTMAGLQGAILLIAAKRADQISSELAHHDDQLLTQNTEQTAAIHEMVSQQQQILARLDQQGSPKPDGKTSTLTGGQEAHRDDDPR